MFCNKYIYKYKITLVLDPMLLALWKFLNPMTEEIKGFPSMPVADTGRGHRVPMHPLSSLEFVQWFNIKRLTVNFQKKHIFLML